MLNRRLTLVLFGLLALIQLAVPASMIHKRATTLSEGALYRFASAPVDPADPFLGRYVVLSLAAERLELPASEAKTFRPGEAVYLRIDTASDGFAVLSQPRRNRPDHGDYLRARVRWHDGDSLILRLPFDRYYMEEALAPEAEKAYWRAQQARLLPAPAEDAPSPPLETYISVRVRRGFAVIEELYLNGQPVADYLASQSAENPSNR